MGVGWRGDWSCCRRGISQSAPEGLFLFREKPPAWSCGSLQQGRAWPLTQPTSPASLGAVRVRIASSPTLNSPQPAPTGLLGFSTSSLFPTLRLQATRSLTVLLRPCLAGEGAVNRLSPRSPAASCTWPGAAATLVPTLIPGTFLSWSNPLTFCFLCPLYFLVSYLYKRWTAFGCSLCFSVEWLGVSPRCRGKLTPLPSISPPSSFLSSSCTGRSAPQSHSLWWLPIPEYEYTRTHIFQMMDVLVFFFFLFLLWSEDCVCMYMYVCVNVCFDPNL